MKKKLTYYILTIYLLVLIIPSLTLGLELILTGSVIEIYDSNITSSWTNQKDDFITNLIIGLGFKHEGQKSNIELTAHSNQRIYFKNHELNYNSQDMNLAYRKDISRNTYFTLTDTFYHSKEPNSFDMVFDRPVNWFEYYQNNFFITYNTSLSNQVNIITQYHNGVDINSNEALPDSYLNGFDFQTDYVISTLTFFSFIYDFEYYKIKSDEDIIINKDRAYKNHFGAGVRHYFTNVTYIDSKGGLDIIKLFDNKNYFKPQFSISIIHETDEDSRFSINISKNNRINPSSQGISDDWRLSLHYIDQLQARLNVSVTVFGGYGVYIPSEIKNQFIGAAGSIIYKITEKINTELTYSYTYSDSSLRPAYSRNTVQVGVRGEL